MTASPENSVSCIGRFCQICNLGLVDYEDGLQLQKELVPARLKGEISDMLLLLEHPAVITLGKAGKEENLLVSRETLQQWGIALFYTDRGGEITVHSPGQLIGYPIIDLTNSQMDPHSYTYQLEETVIRTLSYFHIKAHRIDNYRGVWIEGKKVCSIGAKFNRSITSHGFALNINNDLNYFSLICPCGIKGITMTSMSKVLGYKVTIEEVAAILINEFLAVFYPSIHFGSPQN